MVVRKSRVGVTVIDRLEHLRAQLRRNGMPEGCPLEKALVDVASDVERGIKLPLARGRETPAQAQTRRLHTWLDGTDTHIPGGAVQRHSAMFRDVG